MIKKAVMAIGCECYRWGCTLDTDDMNALYKTLTIAMTWSSEGELICKCSFQTDLNVRVYPGVLSKGAAVGATLVVAAVVGAVIVRRVFPTSQHVVVSARQILQWIHQETVRDRRLVVQYTF